MVKNQHLLLCTLLVGNSMAMEVLNVVLLLLLAGSGKKDKFEFEGCFCGVIACRDKYFLSVL